MDGCQSMWFYASHYGTRLARDTITDAGMMRSSVCGMMLGGTKVSMGEAIEKLNDVMDWDCVQCETE